MKIHVDDVQIARLYDHAQTQPHRFGSEAETQLSFHRSRLLASLNHYSAVSRLS